MSPCRLQIQEIVLPVALKIRSRLGFELFHLSVRLLSSFSFQLLFESPTRGERRKEKNPSADRSAADSGKIEHWRIPAFEGQLKAFRGPYRTLRILQEWAEVHALFFDLRWLTMSIAYMAWLTISIAWLGVTTAMAHTWFTMSIAYMAWEFS